jgi:hypothetical protein
MKMNALLYEQVDVLKTMLFNVSYQTKSLNISPKSFNLLLPLPLNDLHGEETVLPYLPSTKT